MSNNRRTTINDRRTMFTDRRQLVNPALYHSKNARKALQDLSDICQGILTDQTKTISPDQTLFLDTWIRKNQILKQDPGYQDLSGLTTDKLADEIYTQDELNDLDELVEWNPEYRSGRQFAEAEEALHSLLGICKGIRTDQDLNESELLALNHWLGRSKMLNANPIGARLRSQVQSISNDGGITKKEQKNLIQLIKQAIGSDFSLGAAG